MKNLKPELDSKVREVYPIPAIAFVEVIKNKRVLIEGQIHLIAVAVT